MSAKLLFESYCSRWCVRIFKTLPFYDLIISVKIHKMPRYSPFFLLSIPGSFPPYLPSFLLSINISELQWNWWHFRPWQNWTPLDQIKTMGSPRLLPTKSSQSREALLCILPLTDWLLVWISLQLPTQYDPQQMPKHCLLSLQALSWFPG